MSADTEKNTINCHEDPQSPGPSDSTSTLGHVVGTVQLYDEDDTVRLIPVPTSDPRDPLNLPKWRKIAILVTLTFYGITGLTAIATVGSIIPFMNMMYGNPAEYMPKLMGSSVNAGETGGPPGVSGAAAMGGGSAAMAGGISEDLSSGASFSGIPGLTSEGGSSESTGTSDSSRPVKRASAPKLPPDVKMKMAPPFESLSRISLLGSLPSLFMGVSNFITVPLSLAFGRRLLLLSMMAILTAGLVWAKFAENFEHHLAARCLVGLGTGSFESLGPLIVYDIFFLHQRGSAIGALWSFSGMFSFVLGIMCSEVVVAIGWRWLYGILACLSGVGLLAAILFVPETRHLRSIQNINGELVHTDAFGNVMAVKDHQLEKLKNQSGNSRSEYQPRTLSSDLSLIKGPYTWDECWKCCITMVKIAIVPNMLWVILLNSIIIAINISSSLVFADPLLSWQKGGNWESSKLGLATSGMIPAAFLSFFASGWLMDVITKRMSKRNGGVHEPEDRLASLVLPVLVLFVGCISFGVANQDTAKYHWMGSVVGLAFINFGFLCANTTLSVYAVEAYPQWAGPLLVMVCAFRNIISFAITFGVVDFVKKCGFDGAFGIYGGVTVAIALIGAPVFIWGKPLRKWCSRKFGM
ncbi:MFS general substrate transporter [Ascodesmis nigricans]|uniref:MFS general substrate transporter n=1 Tax=Ascodesmis nigricans TaxID=341454 RepID=A0A4S2MY68_9PEZI|nr:MFS general substrate transporter [Ascodesmis nigricans]